MLANVHYLLKSRVKQFSVFPLAIIMIACSVGDQSLTSSSSDMATSQEEVNYIVAQQQSGDPFDRAVGGWISADLGESWIERYVQENGSGFSYLIPVSVLKNILKDRQVSGISFHHAVDNDGDFHVLPIGVNGEGKYVKTLFVFTKDGPVEWRTAMEMAHRYHGVTRSHFFGSNAIGRLVGGDSLEQIEVIRALDLGNQYQLLLSAGGSDNYSGGFTDMSNPCPTICPQ